LVDSSVIESVPKVVACQTRQISPLFHRFKGLRYTPPEKITSVADALVSTNPPLLELMFSRLKEAEGDVVMVEENEIMEAFTELPRRGFFVEPSSAVAYTGYKKQLMTNEVSPEDKVAIILTGNGLKTTTKPVLY
jgi:threonine synthase